MNLKRTGRAAVSAGISLMLALAPVSPSVAFAATNSAIESTSAELEAARAHLNDLASQCETKFAELEDQQAELESTRQQITDTEGQIEVKEQELTDARAVLSQNISENYKTGINFLSFLLGSDSFDDLVSRVYYADKVAAHQNEAISTVLTIQEELDAQKATLVSSQEKQEELVAKTRETASELQQVVTEQQTYVNGLDAQLQAEIAAQQEAERKAAEEQARKEAEERARQEEAQRQAEAAQQGQTQSQTTQEQTSDDEGTGNSGGGSTYVPTPAPTQTYTRPVSNLGSGVGAAIEYAKSQLGVSYSWGGNAIAYTEFDCSGLVWWSFQQAGISIPRGQRLSNGYSSSMIGWCLSNGGWTTSQANLQAGDLMFWGSSVESTGHVGLCIGNGQMIHSNWNGVEITSVYYNAGSFVGGGPVV
ncbi:MAG: C40 family peptidase [Atopobiaceae bacterium]|nr:C40 family peptidase [Atopobiaceae bacterium]